jgi:hypothetical protein
MSTALTDAWDDLDEHLADIDGAELDQVDNPELADRMVRRIMRARRELAAAEEIAATERARIDEWLAKRRAALDTSFLEMCLRTYHQRQLDANPKAKTIHLPAGDLVARKQPDRWHFDDEQGFIEWAQANHPDLVRTVTKVEVAKADTKKVLEVIDDGRVIDPATGERVPAVWVEPGKITFTVKEGDDQ